MNPLRWWIFCRVIDNFGDAGVCLRLANELSARGQSVKLWIDRPEILDWMAPDATPRMEVVHWQVDDQDSPGEFQEDNFADVVIEAFGCEIPPIYQMKIASEARKYKQLTQWINLEYLSAQDYAQQNHQLLSPVLFGPGEGAHKWFFYPGFTPRTGGLILEEHIRSKVQQTQHIGPNSHSTSQLTPIANFSHSRAFSIGLFCYPDAPLDSLINGLRSIHAQNGCDYTLFIPSGDTQGVVQGVLKGEGVVESHGGGVNISNLTYLTQTQFDEMLWHNDLNFVRGEDSLIRAIWAGKPWVWQIYKQSDEAHIPKLNALLTTLECPTFIKEIHWGWNACEGYAFTLSHLNDQEKWSKWHTWCLKIRSKLMEQADLVTQLMLFVDEKRQKTVES